MTILFVLGLGLFSYRLVMNANEWALKPSNQHLLGTGVADLGKIYDRNGIILAETKNGKRIYNSDLNVRKSVLHLTGDNTTFISTAIQNVYRAELIGYNFALGLNVPSFLKESRDIKLTVDSSLCKTAMEQLGNRKGAVCVYNYKTGEILCMASTPTYDPESPPDLKKDSLGKYEGAYVNRVLSASYAPGSTFKIVTGACGIENISNIDEKVFECHKEEKIDSQKITCLSYHGGINFKKAMAESCNIYFADLAMELGKSKMTKTANELGFNKSFKVNDIKIKSSHYNVSNASEVDLGWSGIGQQEDLVNPMHMLRIMGAIANQGVPVEPSLIKSMTRMGKEKSISTTSGDRFLSTNVANKLKETMRYTVKNNSSYSALNMMNICAKTGTAEVGEGKEPHGWVVGFSDDEKTPYAFVVVVENGGYGSKCAVPIAASVLNKIKSGSD